MKNRIIEKGWGNEEIFISNEIYCGKFLKFNVGCKSSMHFHVKKDESWYVLSGKFLLRLISVVDGSRDEIILKPGDVHRNKPVSPHSLECLETGVILEISTSDTVEDNYRIEPGDSQKKEKREKNRGKNETDLLIGL